MQFTSLNIFFVTQRDNALDRLTGWAYAHLVNYFAHPVNSTGPLPKIAHPVNYLAQRNNRH